MTPLPQSRWDQLNASAHRGELFLDPIAEHEVLAACAEFEAEIHRIVGDLKYLGRVAAFGDLPSGVYFGQKFQKKLFEGDDSLTGRLIQMHTEAGKMRNVFTKSFANFKQSDQATRDRLTQLGKQI